jgi:hypothetical protein
MGIAYRCRPNHKLALVVWDGLIAWDEWREHLQRMLFDPDYAPVQSQITDLQHSTIGPTITNNQIQAMIDLVAGLREKLSVRKVAIIAGDDWVKPKLAEVGLQSISITPIVFHDLATACLWLGVDPVEIGEDIQQIRNTLRKKG